MDHLRPEGNPTSAPSKTLPPDSGERFSGSDFSALPDPRDYIEVVLRRKWAALAVGVFIFFTAMIVTLATRPLFRAEGRVELSPQTPRVTKFEEVTAEQLETQEFVQTQLKLFQSASLARRVIDKLNMGNALTNNGREEAGLPRFLRKLRSAVHAWLSVPLGEGGAPSPQLEEMRRARRAEAIFRKNFHVQQDGDAMVALVTFDSPDAAIARDVVNAIIREFIAWQLDSRMEAAEAAKRQLDGQLDAARIRLERAEESLARFARESGIASLDPNLNRVQRQLAEVNRAFAEAETERVAKESDYKRVEKGGAGALPASAESDLLRGLRGKWADAQTECEELALVYKEDYPKLKRLRGKVRDIEGRIREEERRIIEGVRQDSLSSAAREDALLVKAEEVKAMALSVNERVVQYNILAREVEAEKEIHQSLLERSREIDANVGSGMTSIRVVDYAALPLAPFKPRVLFNLLLASIAAAAGAVGAAFLCEHLDNKVKSVDEFQERFHVRVLGALPLVEGKEPTRLDRLTTEFPRSAFAEAVRSVRAAIRLSEPSGERPFKTLLVSSTSPGEGKSTAAYNLAQAFAALGEKVVVLDCDLRRPRLHQALGAPNDTGLSEVLSGASPEAFIVESEVAAGDGGCLHFVPSGPAPPSPSELLASERMGSLLYDLTKRYDRIVLDGPPAAGFSDALILGSLADATLLVAALGETDRETLRIVLRSFTSAGARLMGCIVNKLDAASPYSGYYYKHGKYYAGPRASNEEKGRKSGGSA